MVLPSLVAAGMEMVVSTLVRELRSRGYDAGVTCSEGLGPLADRLREDGVSVRLEPAPGLATIVSPTGLVHWFRARKPDIVHTHSGIWLKAARAARLAGVQAVVHTAHGLPDVVRWHDLALDRWATFHTDVVAAVSRPLGEHLLSRVGVPASKAVVVPNGVDVDAFTPGGHSGALRRELHLPDARTPVVGSVARLAPVKNHALLLDAFAQARAVVPDARLVLVGEGECRPALEAQAARLGLTGAVHLAGERTDMPAIYRDLDCFVLSSHAEGTSISLLEAMASGVPTIATDVGGSPAILDHGACGMLVPAGDRDALARGLTSLLCDEARRRALATAARTRMLAVYSKQAMADRYERLYACALERRPPGRDHG
jgi:glycosyltransferase involved in cell wall biosynthesis